ncbi:hypothetical protein GALMADRAFT_239070 [Galerina marginata CBS 339.88]|uniref:Uncharacterized protein n=1 Tax=Galerina marginata (strain CBS 339.88) TaxID=685588 RepID=A0A067TLK6_GALM3|nr:hypothetical protein GALMADRAFT_239070 [Galerina marginata CBS 339.88]
MAGINISAFPPELLAMIFKYVHIDFLATHDLQAVTGSQNHTAHDFDEDFDDVVNPSSDSSDYYVREAVNVGNLLEIVKSPTVFPYAIASVSPFWENVLSATPEFWTTLVFFLDDDFTEVEKVEKYLSWSCDLPIDVFMTRRADFNNGAGVAETRCVRDNMRSLMPHFHRYTITDGSHNDSAFEFEPRLTALTIDGRNFQRALAENKRWITEQTDLKTLTIFQYVPVTISPPICATEISFDIHECDECRLDLYAVLGKIELFDSLTKLKFDTIHFDISPPKCGRSAFDLTFITDLVFENMAPEIIEEIFRVCAFNEMDAVESITFIRCPRLHQVYFSDLQAISLCLSELDVGVDLKPIVLAWYGIALSISRCASFSDSLLQMLGTKEICKSDDGTEFEHLFHCSMLCFLEIHSVGLPTYSVGALKRMIGTRSDDLDFSDENWRENLSGPAIARLEVTGQVPELSPEDKLWLRSRVDVFSWGRG